MNVEQLYISTIAQDAKSTVAKYGCGLEIAEYCTAWNMDEHFEEVNPLVLKKLDGIKARIFHAPFNELFPCAIDTKARQLAADRYWQAINLAKNYGCTKVVIHGGYNPYIYYPQWYIEQSVKFWKEFLREDPKIDIVLENVLEEKPALLTTIIKKVGSERLSMCLDIGHVNAYSKVGAFEWLHGCAPYITHFHIHNNGGDADRHCALFDGSIDMKAFLAEAGALCPKATFTLELLEAEPSARWLSEQELI